MKTITPKETANQFYSDFEDDIQGLEGDEWYNSAKQCALNAVNKIIELCEFDVIYDWQDQRNIDKLNFWDQVKEELLKL